MFFYIILDFFFQLVGFFLALYEYNGSLYDFSSYTLRVISSSNSTFKNVWKLHDDTFDFKRSNAVA